MKFLVPTSIICFLLQAGYARPDKRQHRDKMVQLRSKRQESIASVLGLAPPESEPERFMFGEDKKKAEPGLREYEPMPEENERLEKISEMFRESMDPSADPCDDFYKFACGNFNRSSNMMTNEAVQILRNRKLESLRSINITNVDPRLKKVYRYLVKLEEKCNLPSEEEGLEHSSSIIKAIGGSPILDGNITKINPFISAMKLRILTGVKTLFDVEKRRDVSNPRKTALYINLPGDFMACDVNFRTAVMRCKQNIYDDLFATDSYIYLLEEGTLTSETQQNYMERALRLIQDSWLLFAHRTDTAVDFEEAKSLAPSLAEALLTQASEKQLEKTRIFLRFGTVSLNARKALPLLEALARKHWRTCQTRIVEWFLRYSHSKKTLCTNSELLALNYAVLHLLVNEYGYGLDRRNCVEEMIKSIRIAFKSMLEHADWMDFSTKIRAIQKLFHVTIRIIAPPLAFDEDAIQEYYQGLPELQGNETLLELLEGVNEMYIKKQFQGLGSYSEPLSEGFSIKRAMMVSGSAYYHWFENSLNILIGSLQPPLYHWNDPVFFTYGAIGVIIGHEFTHAFGKKGSHFDQNGNRQEWMSQESRSNFDEKVECFQEQYSQFCFPDKENNTRCVDGNMVNGEAMCDHGGVRVSYFSFKNELRFQKKRGVTLDNLPKLMPGFENATLEQLFFLSFASQYCVKKQPGFSGDNVYPPISARVTGTLRNLPSFSKTFNCPAGSGMNPEKKCRIW